MKALLVDDHPLVLGALTTALKSLQTFDTIDQEQSLTEAMRHLEATSDYDLILLDLHMSDANGANAVIRLRETYPDMPVVIFSGDEDPATIQTAFEHGVLGYIPKRSSVSQIIHAIQGVLDGSSYVPSAYMKSQGFESRGAPRSRTATPPSLEPKLTPRQQQVFDHLIQGMPNKVIADRLGMAEGTVKTHLYTIYRLFGASNRVQVILKARELGLV